MSYREELPATKMCPLNSVARSCAGGFTWSFFIPEYTSIPILQMRKTDSECKGPTQGRKSGTVPTVFQLQQLRGGLRWRPLSSGGSSQPSDSQSSWGLALLQEAAAGLIRSSEMPSRYSPLGQLIYYASGGQAPGGQLAERRLGASSCLLSPHLLPALGRDLLGQTRPKAVLSLLTQLE